MHDSKEECDETFDIVKRMQQHPFQNEAATETGRVVCAAVSSHRRVVLFVALLQNHRNNSSSSESRT